MFTFPQIAQTVPGNSADVKSTGKITPQLLQLCAAGPVTAETAV